MPHPRHRRFGRLRAGPPPGRRPSSALLPALTLAPLLGLGFSAALALASEGDAPPAPAAPAPAVQPAEDRPAVRPAPQRSPAELFAAVERAWIAGDAGALASYCDSAATHVSMKPGGSPASAPTLGGLAFLIHDPLHLVATRSFRVVRLVVESKKAEARAWARWNGDWGAGKGVRDLEVVLAARGSADGRWLLTEIRTND